MADITSHPFLNVIWTFFVIFVWVAWFWLLITIAIDIFRRRDISGWVKAIWLILVIFIPLIGSLIYLITQGDGMAERSAKEQQQQKAAVDTYIRDTADSGPAAEIARAKTLLDSGAIDQAEYEKLKAKALG